MAGSFGFGFSGEYAGVGANGALTRREGVGDLFVRCILIEEFAQLRQLERRVEISVSKEVETDAGTSDGLVAVRCAECPGDLSVSLQRGSSGRP